MRLVKYFLGMLCLGLTLSGKGQMKDLVIPAALSQEIATLNNPDSVYVYTWNTEAGSWQADKRYIYSYNSYAIKNFEELSHWENETFLPDTQIEYTFNNTTPRETIHYFWDDYYLLWEFRQRYQYSYDSAANLSESVFAKWSESQTLWRNDSLFQFEYNALKQCTAAYISKWSYTLNVWERVSETLLSYDAAGNVIQKQINLWEADLLIWEPKYLNKKTYNDKNQLVEQIQFSMNSYHTQWNNDFKVTYAYAANDLLSEEVYYYWQTQENSWLDDYKFIYTYDASGNELEKRGYYFDIETLVWDNHFKIERIYEESRFQKVTTYTYWNYGKWNPLEKQHFYYGGYTSKAENEMWAHVQVYPNPAQRHIRIELGEGHKGALVINICDLSGKVLFSTKENANQAIYTISLPELSDGVYLMQIKNESHSSTKKIFIRK